MELHNVCWRCLGDDYLQKEIKRYGRNDYCSICYKYSKCYSFIYLVQKVESVFKYHFVPGDYDSRLVVDSDEVHEKQKGSSADEIIQDILQCDHEVAVSITKELEDREKYGVLKQGENGFFFTETNFVGQLAKPYHLYATWDKFCNDIKYKNRFISTSFFHQLNDLFSYLYILEILDPNKIIRRINPGDELGTVYRGRLKENYQEAEKFIHKDLKAELSAPPHSSATAGRMNPAGIPVFYSSSNIDICVAELRPSVGNIAIIGEFEIIREINVLDLTALDDFRAALSLFHPHYHKAEEMLEFMYAFHDEVKKPVSKKDAELEYLPTQAVSEYFYNIFKPKIEGIIFESSQTNYDGKNICLFSHIVQDSSLYQSSYNTLDHISENDENLYASIEPTIKFKNKSYMVQVNSIYYSSERLNIIS